MPASVGSTSGPATTPLASAPRPAAPASNPPPPVSFKGWFLQPGPSCLLKRLGERGQVLWVEQVDMGGNIVLSGRQECLGTSQFGEDLVLVSWSCGIAERTVLPPGGAGRDAGGKCSHVVSHVHYPEPPTLDEFWPVRESALPWHARRWPWWARRWPAQLPTPVTQPDGRARWTSHAAQPEWTPSSLDAAAATTDEPGPPPTWAPWPSSNG